MSEVTEEIVEEVLEGEVYIPRDFTTIKKVAPYVVGISAAFAIGAYLAKRKYQKLYADLAEQEISEAKIFYAALQKPGTPEEVMDSLGLLPEEEENVQAMEKAKVVMRDYRRPDLISGAAETILEENGGNVVRSIFDGGESDVWDYKAEEAARDKSLPYIVSQAEFLENEPEYEQITITYYEGDEVLSDERDQVMVTEVAVGIENLRFGHGSNDKNVVLVRNEVLSLDFEVVRSEGHYAHEVLGLSHSDEDRRRTRKFRPSDD